MITREQVDHVADLARLALSEEERERMTSQLNRILEAASELQELDTSDVPPTAFAVPLQNVFRPDEVRESLPREQVLANAPDPERGFFRVPRIMEEEE
ncbi:MAG TPA: Asp-tRNA(Asn)/Glu-tRNA(Gln) amidotransferase subunit GatC [Firmicutes bacterium]|nr:Asp-tRNA(Asn)/Glu-tRNA(Gln) amidotransferase subunit GatC [Bacillota bacterium]